MTPPDVLSADGQVIYTWTKGAWYEPRVDSHGLPELEHVQDQSIAWRAHEEVSREHE